MPTPTTSEQHIIDTVKLYVDESTEAKRFREVKTENNWDAFHGIQDYSHKQVGQSMEFIPKVSTALEQFVSFFKQALISHGRYFDLEDLGDPDEIITSETIMRLMDHSLREAHFVTKFVDGLKGAALGSTITMKVHGGFEDVSRFFTSEDENGDGTRLKKSTKRRWKLFLDLIRPQDFFPDPRQEGLYAIHRINIDFHRLVDNPDYDQAVIDVLDREFHEQLDENTAAKERGESMKHKIDMRRNVVLWECWGHILGKDGRIVERNVVTTIANRKHLIRPPQPNPRIDGKLPFVSQPILRVPWSAFGRALMDDPADLNMTLNELLNLIIDGAMGEAWGVKQAHPDLMENPELWAEGIPYGSTIEAKPGVDPSNQVVQMLTVGKLPQAIMAVFHLIDKEFQSASMVPDLKIGQLPERQVKATEIVEVSQALTGTFEGIAQDLESEWMEPMLDLVWMSIVQHVGDFLAPELVNVLGQEQALVLQAMTREERIAVLGMRGRFRVHGLSSILSRVKDFTKLVTLIQTVGQTPILTKKFMEKFDMGEFLEEIVTALNINPEKIRHKEGDGQVSEEDLRILQAGAGQQVAAPEGDSAPLALPDEEFVTGSGAGIQGQP